MKIIKTRYPKLNPKDLAKYQTLAAAGYSLRTISDKASIGYYQLLYHYDPARLAAERAKSIENRQKRIAEGRNYSGVCQSKYIAHESTMRIPDTVIEDRNRRYELRYDNMTPNQLLLGDPLPGYSALDRRK